MVIPPFSCPVCGGQFSGQIVTQDVSARGTVSIQRCPTCGLHITYPRLEDPQAPYSAMTAEQWERKYGAIDRGEMRHGRHRNYQEEVAFVENTLPEGARALDVGCNAGWLLGYLQQSRQRFALEGVEPSEMLAVTARRRLGIPIHHGYLRDLAGSPARFDGIVSTDVIEHILPEHVGQFADDLYGLLKPGGHVFIKTPNVGYVALKYRLTRRLPRVMKRRVLLGADVWDAKEHVIHWGAKTLARHFAQHGFQVTRLFVPLPVETRGSPWAATRLRRGIYRAARALGGVPFFAQDLFLIAQKPPSGPD
jgi:2-polyprenyl-3-methyl-5-hydroxy-6-metoxy-1,4-benzoquinol methylase